LSEAKDLLLLLLFAFAFAGSVPNPHVKPPNRITGSFPAANPTKQKSYSNTHPQGKWRSS
jgi:hypothetical protein